jgi:hypothetical protein
MSRSYTTADGAHRDRQSVQKTTEADSRGHMPVDAQNRPKLGCILVCRSLSFPELQDYTASTHSCIRYGISDPQRQQICIFINYTTNIPCC